MRKYLTYAAAAVSAACMLTSCKPEFTAKKPDISGLYSCTADVLWGETDAEITLKRLGNGDWDVAFSSPDTLNGLSVSFRDGDTHCEMNGISADMKKDDIPDGSLFELICGTLDEAALNTSSLQEAENELILKGRTDSGAYELVFEPETLTLCGIRIPDCELEAVIEDFAPITEAQPITETSAE